MTNSYSPRIQAFRKAMIDELPRAPNDGPSRQLLEVMPTRQVIQAFVTWRMRLIPAKPRRVGVWRPALLQFSTVKSELRPLLQKVEAGKDLRPHLSEAAKHKGIILPGAKPSDRGKDIDMVLTRHGLHHFHVGVPAPGNPKGRSGTLVFAEVLDKEFRIIAISDHRAFTTGSTEQLRFFETCQAYMAKDIPPGQAFMANPVMSSGHSMLIMRFGDECESKIDQLDPRLDDPAFIESLYTEQPILRNGLPISKPAKPSLTWYFNDLRFGILDRRTNVFFCIFPFFAR